MCFSLSLQYHLCSAATRALLLTTYIKFINLFPEIKSQIQDVLKSNSNLRSSDAELQQRASEYLHLSITTTTDVLVREDHHHHCHHHYYCQFQQYMTKVFPNIPHFSDVSAYTPSCSRKVSFHLFSAYSVSLFVCLPVFFFSVLFLSLLTFPNPCQTFPGHCVGGDAALH